jgi:hypothetical protein
VEAAVAKREEARQIACWRWMLLPPRLRPVEVPEGMDPSTSDAAAAAAAAAPAGDAAVGRYLQIFWAEDDAWYDGLVEGYDAATGAHTVRYILDDVTEAVGLDTTTFHHVIIVRQITVQPMTASVVHVTTNLTPGSDNPCSHSTFN